MRAPVNPADSDYYRIPASLEQVAHSIREHFADFGEEFSLPEQYSRYEDQRDDR